MLCRLVRKHPATKEPLRPPTPQQRSAGGFNPHNPSSHNIQLNSHFSGAFATSQPICIAVPLENHAQTQVLSCLHHSSFPVAGNRKFCLQSTKQPSHSRRNHRSALWQPCSSGRSLTIQLWATAAQKGSLPTASTGPSHHCCYSKPSTKGLQANTGPSKTELHSAPKAVMLKLLPPRVAKGNQQLQPLQALIASIC